MSFIKKIKSSKLFNHSSSSSSNNNIKKVNNSNDYTNHLNVDTTIISDNNTSTTLSSPYTNNTTIISNHFKTPNGTLNNRNSIDLKLRNLTIYHIDPETEGNFCLGVKDSDLGEVVLEAVCNHYNLTDYKEYFGLKYTLVDDNGDYEVFWLDPLKTILKQLKDTNNVLTFRVKHFPGKPHLIDSEYVRYLIFLQIRNYFLKGDLQLSIHDENILASFAVQAALGDYDPDIHQANYLNELKFLSRKALKSQDVIVDMHKQLIGRTPAEMELAFLEKASQFDTYGAELIIVKNSKGVAINFGVSHNGIITYLHGQASDIPKIGLYPWTQIGKISYEGRSLRVHALTPDMKNPEVIKKHVMLFKCNSKRICKHLWKFILDQKSFFNFKCGADVPKIKSSNRLFARKSKFRYSGRCESELISQQQHSPSDKKQFNISPISISSSTNSDTMSTFKRRTFLNVQRVTLSHDNNNLLLMKKELIDDNNNSNNNTNNNNNDSNERKTSTNETSSQTSQQTVITHNNSITLNSQQDGTATTSTPEMNKKTNTNDEFDDDEKIKEELYDTVEPFINIKSRNRKAINKSPAIQVNFTLLDEKNNSDDNDATNNDDQDENDMFYDPCDIEVTASTSLISINNNNSKQNGSLLLSTNNQNITITNGLIKMNTASTSSYQIKQLNPNRSSSNKCFYIILIGLFLIIILIVIVYYIDQPMTNFLPSSLLFKRLVNYVTGDNSIIRWHQSSSDNNNKDPIFSWFLSQYSKTKPK